MRGGELEVIPTLNRWSRSLLRGAFEAFRSCSGVNVSSLAAQDYPQTSPVSRTNSACGSPFKRPR